MPNLKSDFSGNFFPNSKLLQPNFAELDIVGEDDEKKIKDQITLDLHVSQIQTLWLQLI